MKITNKENLPQAFVSMASEEYNQDRNEWRVTQLLKAPREAILEKRHNSEIESDCSDMIWLLFGTAVHSILERSDVAEDEMKETRVKYRHRTGYTLSGQFDLYNERTKTITDYKTASVWKAIFGDYSDWRKQLLMYAYMLRSNGFDVEHGEIVAIMKDHSIRDARFKPDYPKRPVKKITFNFKEHDFEEIEDYIDTRLALLKSLENMPDDALPVCSAEERWNKGDKYAVMPKGKKRALRVFDTKEEAEAFPGGETIEVRPGEDTKCISYCSACEFCNYYKENVKNGKVD